MNKPWQETRNTVATIVYAVYCMRSDGDFSLESIISHVQKIGDHTDNTPLVCRYVLAMLVDVGAITITASDGDAVWFMVVNQSILRQIRDRQKALITGL